MPPDAFFEPDAPMLDAGVSRSGVIQLSEYETVAGPMRYMIADFAALPLDALDRGLYRDCVVTEVGSCVARSCSGPQPWDGAGTITVSFDGTDVLSAVPIASGHYYGDIPMLAPGIMISARTTGDVVPAFATSVVVPSGTSTALPATISVDADLIVAWDPAISATTVAFAMLPDAGLGRAGALCTVPAEAGTMTVSRSIVALVGAGATSVALAGVNTTLVAAGEYQVELRAVVGAQGGATIL
jgi:hypothetical protein